MQRLIILEQSESNRNIWLLNAWLKTANLMTMDVLTKLRDKDGRSFNEPGFMKNQEIYVSIIKINDLIVKAIPRTTEIMWDKEKVLDSCEWVESLVEDLFIFNKDIFPNRTIEANIVWTEILENIIYHIDNMVDSPILWTVNNRFWLNSKFHKCGIDNLYNRACFCKEAFNH